MNTVVLILYAPLSQHMKCAFYEAEELSVDNFIPKSPS